MNKKLQVFVSSTYTDLIEERQAAVEAILDAGHIPAGMELFKAGKSQLKTIYKWIDESDVYMLILGGRYGSIEEESGLSYTELEYGYALSKNMPVFAIVLDDSFLHLKAASKGREAVFEKNNINLYENFKIYVKSNIVKFVYNADQISSVIHSHLNYILNEKDYNLIGWTRNHNNVTIAGQNSTSPKTEKMFGKYTFLELVNVFLETKLYKELTNSNFIIDPITYPIRSFFLFQDMNDPKYLALNIFIKYYDQFCYGISPKILPGNSWLYNIVCPFFEQYNLIEKNKTWTSTYQISELGRLFYEQLKTEHYL